MIENYFSILGLNSNASKNEIDEAYRKLVIKYHPDKNPGNPDSEIKFKEIQKAYENIINLTPNFNFGVKNDVDNIFNNILSKFFGDQKKDNNSSRIRIKISLEESYNGCSKILEIDQHLFCENCRGTGGQSWEHCIKCYGKGYVGSSDSFSVQSSCAFCSGKGSNIKDKCKTCSGRGFLFGKKKQLIVEIPPGIEDETQIRHAGESPDGGDLYVTVTIQKDSKFSRDQQNIICDYDASYHDLIFGGKQILNLFNQNIEFNLKPRTKTGSKIIIKDKGFSSLKNPLFKGDVILTIQLKLPEKINQEYKNLIQKLDNFENSIL